MEKTRDPKNLVVKFHEIPQGGLEFHFQNSGPMDPSVLDLLGNNPVYDITMNVDQNDQMTQLKGQITAQVPFACSRCAEDFVLPVKKSFATLYYKSENDIKNVHVGDELQTAFEMEQNTSGVLDLGEVVHEQIALEIPFQPLCSESCKGLCSQCGANLNVSGPHDHPEFKIESSSPFAKLGQVKVGKQRGTRNN